METLLDGVFDDTILVAPLAAFFDLAKMVATLGSFSRLSFSLPPPSAPLSFLSIHADAYTGSIGAPSFLAFVISFFVDQGWEIIERLYVDAGTRAFQVRIPKMKVQNRYQGESGISSFEQ
jgi:hypothetical protein